MNTTLAALRKKAAFERFGAQDLSHLSASVFLSLRGARHIGVSLGKPRVGHAFHAAVGVHLTKSSEFQTVPLDELVEAFRHVFLAELAEGNIPVLFDDEEQSADELIDKARDMLGVFVAQFPMPSLVLGIEVPFELVLQHPCTGETAELPLIGAMDVIGQFDTQRRILEIKTGKRTWSADQVDYDLQPTIYRKAAGELGHQKAETELVVITKAKKPTLHRLACARSQRDEIELVELALSVEQAVRAGVDFRRRDWQCRSCGYAQRCSP